jgi:hypothetical protein
MKAKDISAAGGVGVAMLGIVFTCFCGCGGSRPDGAETASLRDRVSELERRVEGLVEQDRLVRYEVPPVAGMDPEVRKQTQTSDLVRAAFQSKLIQLEDALDELAIVQNQCYDLRRELERLRKR